MATPDTNEDLKLAPVDLTPEPEHGQTHVVDPEHNGPAAWNGFMEGTPKLLQKAFSGYTGARSDAQKQLSTNFTTKDYETRAPLLSKYAASGDIPSGQTLRERIRGLLPR